MMSHTMMMADPQDVRLNTSRRLSRSARRSTLGAIGLAGAVIVVGLLAGACGTSSTAAAGNGTMAAQLTDAPFLTDSVRSVDLFVVRVDARMADADSSTAAKGSTDDSAKVGGWTTLATPNESVNLLAFQNGVALPIGQLSMPAGNYLGFRLVIDATRSSITLKNGAVLTSTSTPNVAFPSASRSGIKIVLTQPVVVTANQTTTVLIDFMVLNSFVMRGSSISQNGLLFTPVVHASVR